MSSVIELHGRNLLTLNDYSRQELCFLLDLAAELKTAKREGREHQNLRGKNIAAMFERESARPHSAFEVAAHDQGANVTFIGPIGAQMSRDGTVRDTARVLGRMYDAIEYRGSETAVAEGLARWAGVPVYKGLTDESHPAQVLADFLTFEEHVPAPLDAVAFCYLGDGRVDLAGMYLIGGAKLGMDVRIAGPRELWPQQEAAERAREIARESGARITITEDLEEAVRGCDVLITDVWVPAADHADVSRERIERLLPYQVNSRTMQLTGNPDIKFMHCLPEIHGADTSIGGELCDRLGLHALEVSDDVFESPASVVFDEAENRLHTIKAVLVATLGS